MADDRKPYALSVLLRPCSDPELTCIVCGGAGPCHFELRSRGNGRHITAGAHDWCLDSVRQLNPPEAAPLVEHKRGVFVPFDVKMPATTTTKIEGEILQCEDCGADFVFEIGEQEFFDKHGFSKPRRCPSCRARMKAKRGASP
jgi:ssDNA-binding Zn-finger/Zn-ribbon topoisomerase 1